VSGALLYLATRSTINRLGRRAVQLRRPRYLLAFILGIGYIVVLVGSQPRRPSLHTVLPSASAELVGALLLVGAAAWSWTFGSERRALAFTAAEVTFLFPAPVTRRALIHYRLARLQILILLNVAIWTLLLGRQAVLPAWQRAIALWVLLCTIVLHRTGAALVRRSVAEHRTAGLRRRMLSLTLVAVGAAGLVSAVTAALPRLAELASRGPAALLFAAEAAAAAPLAGELLLPFRVAVAPLTAAGGDRWMEAIAPAFVLLLLHYGWVLRADTAFEEAAAEWSLERARRGAAPGRPPAGRPVSPTLLPLAARGRRATALVWKNLAAVFRLRRVRSWALGYGMLGTLLGSASLAGAHGLTRGAGALALTWAGFALLLGPQWVRNDLRRDLRQLELLRTFPLRGRTVIAAEAAASTVSLTLIQFALLGAAWLSFLGEESGETTLGERTVVLAAAALVLPLVNYTALLLQNGAALLYPAWMSAIGDGGGGLEALGQNLLATVAFAFLLALLLAPPLGVGALVLYVLNAGPVAVALGGLVAVALLGSEAALLARVLGSVYDRTDASTPGIRG
jgi:ABC-2 type transport system permease protein